MRVDDGFLTLFDMTTGEVVASHRISPERGVLVRNNNHLRDNSKSIDELYDKVLVLLGGSEKAAAFLNALRHEKPRYVRDQFRLMADVAGKYPATIVGQAISYCLDLKLFSAVECRDAAGHFLGQNAEETEKTQAIENAGVWPLHLRVRAEHRSVTVYTELLGGDGR